MEQVTRIGLVTKPWQGLVLPLNYTCKFILYNLALSNFYNSRFFGKCQEKNQQNIQKAHKLWAKKVLIINKDFTTFL